jgi:CubicO group peptidase (beta-lactamase class C family)
VPAIDDLIREHVERRTAVGAAVAVLQGGEITYAGGFGVTSVEDGGVGVTSQTLFAYGSISKNVCAALIMRLVEEGRLLLDAPVVEYLPALRFVRNEAYGRRITLRHLLSHTSGLPMAGKYWGPRDPDALRRSVYEQVAHFSFLAAPGTMHLYSNMVFCVAGHVAEAVTGRHYDDLAQDYVLDPLRMARTTFDPSVAMTYPVALPHEDGPDGEPRAVHRMPSNASGHPSSFALGSVTDLANLASMYLNEGRFDDRVFLEASSLAEMQRLHASRQVAGAAHPLAHVSAGYGLGFSVGEYRGRRTARHGGMNPGYNCFFDLFPDEGAGFVLLTSHPREEPLMSLVAALYDHVLGLPHEGIAFLAAPTARPLDRDRMRRLAGTFVSVDTGDLVSIVVTADGLVLERREVSLPLVHIGGDAFYAEASPKVRLPVTFDLGGDGEVGHVMIRGEPYHPVDIDPAFVPDARDLQSYVGLYRDPSNAADSEMVSVRVEDGVVYIAEGGEEAPTSAIGERRFLAHLDMGSVEFEDTTVSEAKVLVRGKATRYYPVDELAYRDDKVVRYLVEVPVH